MTPRIEYRYREGSDVIGPAASVDCAVYLPLLTGVSERCIRAEFRLDILSHALDEQFSGDYRVQLQFEEAEINTPGFYNKPLKSAFNESGGGFHIHLIQKDERSPSGSLREDVLRCVENWFNACVRTLQYRLTQDPNPEVVETIPAADTSLWEEWRRPAPITLSYQYKVRCGHNLTEHHKCCRPHGEMFILNLKLQKPGYDPLKNSFIVDFSVLKQALDDFFHAYDHHFLTKDKPLYEALEAVRPGCAVLMRVEPSCENLSDYWFVTLGEYLRQRLSLQLVELQVCESELEKGAIASYR